jgi:hypothetical protein
MGEDELEEGCDGLGTHQSFTFFPGGGRLVSIVLTCLVRSWRSGVFVDRMFVTMEGAGHVSDTLQLLRVFGSSHSKIFLVRGVLDWMATDAPFPSLSLLVVDALDWDLGSGMGDACGVTSQLG